MKRTKYVLMATLMTIVALSLFAAETVNSVGENVIKGLAEKEQGWCGFLCLMDIKTGQKIFYQSYGKMPQTISPTSLVKPLVINSALMAGVIQEDQVIDCGNKSILVLDGGIKLRDVHECGRLSVGEILKSQSNIGTFLIMDLCRKNNVSGYKMSDAELVKYSIGSNPVSWDFLLKEWQTMLVKKQKIVPLLAKYCQVEQGVAVSATCFQENTYFPSCIGYFPIENPRYILLIAVSARPNQPYSGMQVAMPIWKKTCVAMLNCLE